MCTTSIPPPSFIHYLERRRSSANHLANPSTRHHHRPFTQRLARLDPTIWLAPAILRAHDAHEYRKDRRRCEEAYRYHHRPPEEGDGAHVRAPIAHHDDYRTDWYHPDAYSHAKTMSSTTATTATAATTTVVAMMGEWPRSWPLGGEGVPDATALRRRRNSEMSLNDRARALEWVGSTSVFSPGVLQDWMVVSDAGCWGDDGVGLAADDRFGPDPWALRPMDEMY